MTVLPFKLVSSLIKKKSAHPKYLVSNTICLISGVTCQGFLTPVLVIGKRWHNYKSTR